MHEPGPPRATSVGRPVELAPRDPDPDGRYAWTLRDRPDESDGDVLVAGETGRDDDPVVRLDPDAPGTYVAVLDAPDGTHRQRVLAFPDERRETTVRVPAADLPVADDAVDRVSVSWRHNDHRLARDRPVREGDEWVLRTRVPPGRHDVAFAANDDLANAARAVHEVPGPGRPRLSLDARVEEGGAERGGDADGDGPADRLVVTAAVGVPPGSDAEAADVDVTFLVDDRDVDPETASRIEARADGRTLVVPLEDLSDGARIHAVASGERHGAMDAVGVERESDGSLAASDPHAPPAWADSPTVYEVYVRSFAGDTLPTTFAEIERRVPYLESLGVDALWLTPVLASPTEHGYHVTDYTETAADLGSRAAFESLVEACHAAGVRVVFDLVINHTSRDHPAFQLHAAGVEAYADHYRRVGPEKDPTDVDWARLDAGAAPEVYFEWGRIPNLNFDSPTVRSWLLDVVDEWAAVVDGFRADVAWGVPHGFWKEVADRVPDEVLLLDETIPHDPFYAEGEFDLHYDTSLYRALTRIGDGEASADAVADALDRATRLGFDDQGAQMRYVENHDEDRYRAEYGEAAFRAAVAVTFTLPGAPMVYAGGERGNETTRGPFKWHDGDNALTDYHRRLSALRDAEPLLRTGTVAFEGAAASVAVRDGEADRVTAYERTLDEEAASDNEGRSADGADRLLVVVNFADGPATVGVPAGFDRDLFADESVGETVVVDSVAVLA